MEENKAARARDDESANGQRCRHRRTGKPSHWSFHIHFGKQARRRSDGERQIIRPLRLTTCLSDTTRSKSFGQGNSDVWPKKPTLSRTNSVNSAERTRPEFSLHNATRDLFDSARFDGDSCSSLRVSPREVASRVTLHTVAGRRDTGCWRLSLLRRSNSEREWNYEVDETSKSADFY